MVRAMPVQRSLETSYNWHALRGIHTLGVDIGGVLVVNHVELVGDLALGVGDDGEGELGASNLIDVLDPGLVRLGAVGALYMVRTW